MPSPDSKSDPKPVPEPEPKPKLTAAFARRLITMQHPRFAALPIRPVARQGHDHRSFRVGDELVARFPAAARYRHQVVVEDQVLPRLQAGLTTRVPEPVAAGRPSADFPWRWSIRRWIPGRAFAPEVDGAPADPIAHRLAELLLELRSLDTAGGPLPGPRNFHRGGDFAIYAEEARAAAPDPGLEGLSAFDRESCLDLIDRALQAPRCLTPCWLHGDLTADHLLLRGPRLVGLIDFGAVAVGDPACDLTIAWTAFADASRARFFEALGASEPELARARGWALWKALITLRDAPRPAGQARLARQTIKRLIGA